MAVSVAKIETYWLDIRFRNQLSSLFMFMINYWDRTVMCVDLSNCGENVFMQR